LGSNVAVCNQRALARLAVADIQSADRFRARENVEMAVPLAYNKHLAVVQQRRRVIIACGGEAGGG